MKEKQEYIAPEVEVIEFECDDVIGDSDSTPWDDNNSTTSGSGSSSPPAGSNNINWFELK